MFKINLTDFNPSQVGGDDQCVTIFNDVESYINTGKFLIGGNVFSEHMNRLLWDEIRWILFTPKVTAISIFEHSWSYTKYTNNKANEKPVFPYHKTCEILDELLAKARLQQLEIIRNLRKQIQENLSLLEAIFSVREFTSMKHELARTLLPICRDVLFMVKIAVEAFELHIQSQSAPGFSLKHSPLYNLSKSQSVRHVRGRDLRMISVSIDDLQTAVVLKYFSHEMNMRERSNAWKL